MFFYHLFVIRKTKYFVSFCSSLGKELPFPTLRDSTTIKPTVLPLMSIYVHFKHKCST